MSGPHRRADRDRGPRRLRRRGSERWGVWGPFRGPHVERRMEFVEVGAGAFRMGWSGGHPAERPAHVVWVDAFRIAVTPVTNAEWAAWRAATGAAPPAFWGTSGFDAPDQPVVGVAWDEAVTFAAWSGA